MFLMPAGALVRRSGMPSWESIEMSTRTHRQRVCSSHENHAPFYGKVYFALVFSRVDRVYTPPCHTEKSNPLLYKIMLPSQNFLICIFDPL